MFDRKILSNKRIIIVSLAILLLLIIFYYATFEEIKYSFEADSYISTEHVTPSLTDGTAIKQKIDVNKDYIRNIQLLVGTYGRVNTGEIIISLYDDGKVISSKTFSANKIEDNSCIELPVNSKVSNEAELVIEAEGATADEAVTLYYGDSKDKSFFIDGSKVHGILSMTIERGIYSKNAKVIEIALICIFIISVWCLAYAAYCEGVNRSNFLLDGCKQINKYFFLIKQLVQRDYKAKYMRSVLGLLWSLLYPVLMMGVQYVVFSTLFKTNIRYYPVYLLCANAMFTFFSNSVSSGLTSIVNNASLITKVYVPKYLYPMTKVLSTSIDLFLSMIPLTIVVLLVGAPITKAWLLIPLAFVLLMIFSAGMAFLLSTVNVFFRDTQFLWGLATTIWMYATPLFYPETAIPEKYRFLFNLNPMYHYISFFRKILMYGYSPTMIELVTCIVFAIVIYAVGILVFKKNEGKFILYI